MGVWKGISVAWAVVVGVSAAVEAGAGATVEDGMGVWKGMSVARAIAVASSGCMGRASMLKVPQPASRDANNRRKYGTRIFIGSSAI